MEFNYACRIFTSSSFFNYNRSNTFNVVLLYYLCNNDHYFVCYNSFTCAQRTDWHHTFKNSLATLPLKHTETAHHSYASLPGASQTKIIKENSIYSNSQAEIPRIKYISDFTDSATINPIIALSLAIVLFSTAGIPPLAGFYSKAFVLFAAVSANQYIGAIIAIIASVIACFYYLRLVKTVYFGSGSVRYKDQKQRRFLSFIQINKSQAFVIAITTCFLLIFSLKADALILTTHTACITLA